MPILIGRDIKAHTISRNMYVFILSVVAQKKCLAKITSIYIISDGQTICDKRKSKFPPVLPTASRLYSPNDLLQPNVYKAGSWLLASLTEMFTGLPFTS